MRGDKREETQYLFSSPPTGYTQWHGDRRPWFKILDYSDTNRSIRSESAMANVESSMCNRSWRSQTEIAAEKWVVSYRSCIDRCIVERERERERGVVLPRAIEGRERSRQRERALRRERSRGERGRGERGVRCRSHMQLGDVEITHLQPLISWPCKKFNIVSNSDCAALFACFPAFLRGLYASCFI